ncbi:unnamed protein product [Rotaria magnacalcarata]
MRVALKAAAYELDASPDATVNKLPLLQHITPSIIVENIDWMTLNIEQDGIQAVPGRTLRRPDTIVNGRKRPKNEKMENQNQLIEHKQSLDYTTDQNKGHARNDHRNDIEIISDDDDDELQLTNHNKYQQH